MKDKDRQTPERDRGQPKVRMPIKDKEQQDAVRLDREEADELWETYGVRVK